MGLRPSDFGADSFVRELAQKCITPLVARIYPQFRNLSSFKDLYSKVVKYKIGEDEDWHVHVDHSDITVNICLGKEFTGANLLLYGRGQEKITQSSNYVNYKHVPGRMIVHLGSERHGVSQLETGIRYSLIILLREPVFE